MMDTGTPQQFRLPLFSPAAASEDPRLEAACTVMARSPLSQRQVLRSNRLTGALTPAGSSQEWLAIERHYLKIEAIFRAWVPRLQQTGVLVEDSSADTLRRAG